MRLAACLSIPFVFLFGCPSPASDTCGHRLVISVELDGVYPPEGLEFTLVDGVKEHPPHDCIPGSGDDFEVPCEETLEAIGLVYSYHDEFNDPLPVSVAFAAHVVDGQGLLSEVFEPQFALEIDGIDAECFVAHQHFSVPLP